MESNLLKISEQVGRILKQQELTLAAAESCTGGALLSSLTDIPGSSAYVVGGTVAYSNKVKIDRLRVSESDVEKYGAVSKPVALQMAKNIAKIINADIGVSTTGIAGPGGGTEKKPVGSVWIGFWSEKKHVAGKANFSGTRLEIKKQTVKAALQVVISSILNKPNPKNLTFYQPD